MKSFWIAVVAGAFTAGAFAQGSGASASGNASASANASGNAGGSAASSSLSSGTNVQAELTKSLDAKKAKVGDQVTARVTQDVKSNGQVVVRKGSKLVGHVTEAKARSQGESESRLGIAFDRAVLKDGQEIAFNAAVQALAPAVNAAAGADDSAMLGGSSPAPMPSSSGAGTSGAGMGGPVGAIGSTVGRAVGNTAGTVAGTANGTVKGAGGVLNSSSHGVIGLQGLTLSSSASGSAQGSVISSNSQNVKLDSGTQMVLQVNGSTQ
ncbi:MAG TPA: hypothetical protein VG759_12775 [Candidatus Angelobacter sp.]|jgi:hypothetical protein|nr:hypothetical protein [Candidatus Angelobacter sp.]